MTSAVEGGTLMMMIALGVGLIGWLISNLIVRRLTGYPTIGTWLARPRRGK